MIFLKMTETRFELKPGTKGVYIEISKDTKEISEDQYNNIIDACSGFRRIGGSETLQKTCTSRGYKGYQLTSKSPDRSIKVVRVFDWDNSENRV